MLCSQESDTATQTRRFLSVGTTQRAGGDSDATTDSVAGAVCESGSACTCTVRPLVGAFSLGAAVLPLGQSGQLGGDLLLHSGGLLHLVGGADQVDGQLCLHRLDADALLARRHLGRGFGGGGYHLELRWQSPGFAQHAAPKGLVAPALTAGRETLRMDVDCVA